MYPSCKAIDSITFGIHDPFDSGLNIQISGAVNKTANKGVIIIARNLPALKLSAIKGNNFCRNIIFAPSVNHSKAHADNAPIIPTTIAIELTTKYFDKNNSIIALRGCFIS